MSAPQRIRMRSGPWIDTEKVRSHPTVMVTIDGTEHGPFCGYSWCSGACELPAAEIHADGRALKAMGVMVACGAAWQQYRQPWAGQRVRFSDELADEAKRKMWL